MKKLLICLALFGICGLCSSAYLSNVPLKLSQADGETIEAFSSGDEYYHWVHDKDNYTILQNSQGWYVYAEQNGDEIFPGNLVVGKNSPKGLEPGINYSASLIAERRNKIRGLLQRGNSRTPNSGTMNNLVIFIKFAGETDFDASFSDINRMFNADGLTASSLKRYYLETSYNQLLIESSFYPSPLGDMIYAYTDIHPRGYYQPLGPDNPIGYISDGWDWVVRETELLTSAMNAVTQLIPPSLNVDTDSDGYVDNLCFIVKGDTGAWADLLWPHMGSFGTVPVTINGAIPSNYNLQLESFLMADYGGTSVLAHEMFHSIGAPDLYRYENTSITPVGKWDIMSNNRVPPQQPGAWMKYQYGHWVSAPTAIFSSGTYSLSPVGASSTNICYRINSWQTGEYYLLEYRKPCGNIDTMIPATGLLVYRLLLNVQGNSYGPPDELYIYRPNSNSNYIQGNLDSAALSQQNGFSSITESTVPSGFTSINAPGGLNLYDVGLAGETISFKVKISNVQLTSPVGGDVWVSGSQRTIRWRSKSSEGNVKLEFSPDLGQNWLSLVESTPNTGSFVWDAVPAMESNQCFIKVSLLNSYHTDTCSYPFCITSSLAAPSLAYPAEGAIGMPTNPVLTWHKVPGASSYAIQIADAADFGNLVQNATAADSCFQASGLSPQTLYYWRVASMAASVTSEYSLAQSFRTGEISEVPGIPVLVSPMNHAINQSLNPVLSWNNVALATDYHLQLATDAYFTNLVADTLSAGQTSWIVPTLSVNTTYYWRVSAVNGAGSSFYTSSWSFTTGSGSALVDPANSLLTTCLGPNYPNPFNPRTTISLSVADTNAPLRVSIYNLRGQMLKLLYNGLPTAKSMRLEWDSCDEAGNPVGSGIYFYRMQTGRYDELRKMLLMK